MCPYDSCDYSIFGLPSKSALKTHLTLYHDDLSQITVFPDIKQRTLEQALEDAVVANNLLAIRDLAADLASVPERKKGFVLQALTLGYREATLVLLDLLGTPPELDHVQKRSVAILHVCEIGDEELFDILVEKGADINVVVGHDKNALTIASQNGHLSIVRKLLDNKGYNRGISRANRYSRTGALAMASSHGHVEVVSLLLERDSVYFLAKGSLEFYRALEGAVKGKKVACAKLLLSWALGKDASMLPQNLRKISAENIDHSVEYLLKDQANTVKKDGGTKGNALQAMAYRGDCEGVSRLLDLGADIDNCEGKYGTALMAAAKAGNLEIIRLLIERGADIMKKDDTNGGSGGSSIDIATARGHEIVVRELLVQGAFFTLDSIHWIHGCFGMCTPLQAVSMRTDSAALIKLLIESGANIDALPKQGGNRRLCLLTPLQLAVKYGADSTLKILLEYGANVNAKSEDWDHPGDTALHIAAKLGKSDTLEILLDYGADIKAINARDETALIAGARCSSSDTCQKVVRILVERGSELAAADKQGNTVLLAVAKYQNQPLEIIKFLVEMGADIAAVDNDGNTLLLTVVKYHNEPLNTIKYLFETGTDILAADNNGNTVLLAAAKHQKNSLETIKYLVEIGADIVAVDNNKNTVLLAITEYWNQPLEAIKYLAEMGADISAVNNDGNTVLLTVAKYQTQVLEVVKLLIEMGADIAAVDNDGNTVLLAVAKYQKDSLEAIKFLIEMGADISVVDNDGNTVLMAAIKNRNQQLEIIEYLIDMGADVEVADKHGNTALLTVARYWNQSLGVIQFLVGIGADISGVDNDGNTLLMAAVKNINQELETIGYLINMGADIEAVNKDGNTALMVAAGSEWWSQPTKAIQFLLETGAESSTRNLKGLTALMLAAKYESDRSVECLLQHRMSQYIECGEIWSVLESAIQSNSVRITEVILESLSKTTAIDHEHPLSEAPSFAYLKKVAARSRTASILDKYEAALRPLLPDETNSS